MIAKEPRAPKIGERVDFQQSVYVVLRVYADRKRVFVEPGRKTKSWKPVVR